MPLATQEIRTFFVTSVTANRRRLFQVEENARLFLKVLAENREKKRLACHALVIMPDHFHLILAPAPDVSLEKALQYLKGGFSFQLKSKLDVWEKSFMEHRIQNALDYRQHVEYIFENPVAEGLVTRAKDFPFSSASQLVSVDPAPWQFVDATHG